MLLVTDVGVPAAAPANQPLAIDDPGSAWIVESGTLDMFFVPMRDGQIAGARRHVLRAVPGEAVFGFDPEDGQIGAGMLVVGSPDGRLRRVGVNYLKELGSDGTPNLTGTVLLDSWVASISQATALEMAPRAYARLEPGQKVRIEAGKSASCNQDVVWVKHVQGSSQFLGIPGTPSISGAIYFPLTARTWLVATEDCVLECVDTASLQKLDPDWDSVAFFHRVILATLMGSLKESDQRERERLIRKDVSDLRIMRAALARLATPLSSVAARASLWVQREADPLVAACQMVGSQVGVEIRGPVGKLSAGASKDPVREIARVSNIRVRRVLLRGRWWKDEHGPLLGFLQEGNQPVALLPVKGPSYEMHNPAGGVRRLNAEAALALDPFAYSFYEPFPTKKLSGRDLIDFGLKKVGPELNVILLTGIAGGLLGLVTPIFTGMLFETVIPGAQRTPLLQLTGLLLAAAVATAMFELTRSLALLRVEGKLGASMQAAVWDRLLALPVSFFRDYNAGDLSDRANGIDAIRSALTGTVTNSIVSGIFSVFNLALMFYYSWKLATVALGLIIIAVVATLIAGFAQIKQFRILTKTSGRLSGQVLQFITGIAKFRVSGTENRAFAAWSKGYSHMRQIMLRTRSINNNFSVFNSAFLVFGPMAIFYSVYDWTGRFGAGDFLAFNSAFGQMFGATMSLAGAVIQVMTLLPFFERATPILHSAPEVGIAKTDPGELSGDIEVSHLAFRYVADGPLILKDVSFRVEPGQFVAFVGPSGCGKSTLLRMLLGFENPEAGSVYYDGQDLGSLDLNIVRRQMGVVLQNSTLFRGDLFANIIGSKPLTLDDAWEAARLSGLDADIKQMPMGMNTVISEGGGGLSGGQRQRLMIARAIVSRPRILFFDEATSALDNHTQAIVSRSLEGLKATRIVIAHRLSTIINADRIFVFEHGNLVQSGSYAELIDQEGLFAQLAKRQLT